MWRDTTVPLVGVVDDDESTRNSIASLMRSFGYRTEAFSSAYALLDSEYFCNGGPTILVLDVQMPGLNGLELQSRLVDLQYQAPIIFISAQDDETTRAKALRQGAFAFLSKPFSERAILEAIRSAADILNRRP